MNNKKYGSFGLRRKSLIPSYKSIISSKNYFKPRYSNVDTENIIKFVNGDMLDPYFATPGSQLGKNIKISGALYSQNRIYANMLDYLANMYYYRYKVIPRKIKNKPEVAGKSDYKTQYAAMLELVDGMSLETIMPELLLNLFKNGRLYLYCDGNSSSKTITTLTLPNKYCKPSFQTQFGTSQVIFDLAFFDSLSLSAEDIQLFLDFFPNIFKTYYDTYKKDRSKQFVNLDGKYATCISLNDKGFPTLLGAFYDIIDYKTYKINELNSNTNKLERVIVQKINMKDSDISLVELKDLHDSIAGTVESDGTKFITTIGDIQVRQLQEASTVQDTALKTAYSGIFSGAGFNDSVFTGTTTDSVKTSLTRDAAMVWKYIQQITSFFNLAINNIHNFGNYQLAFSFLPITKYNEQEKLAQYNNNATLGVGIIDLIVATGIKQVELDSTLKLEEVLSLSTKLKPLQSSHTQSSTKVETDVSKTDTDSKDKNEEKEKEISNTGDKNER